MRKQRELTEQEKHEIKRYVYRRKQYKITVPLIALCSGYDKVHLAKVETFKYRMSESVKKAYDSVIKMIEKKAKSHVKYEKLSEK